MQDKGGTDHRTQIIVAVIELAGVLGTTAIANFPLLLEVFGVSTPQRHEAGGHRGQPPGPGAGFGGDGRGASVAGNRSPSAADRLQIRPSVAPPLRFEPRNPFTLGAVIDDPDGYTNVRGWSSGSGAIIDLMVVGEVFYT